MKTRRKVTATALVLILFLAGCQGYRGQQYNYWESGLSTGMSHIQLQMIASQQFGLVLEQGCNWNQACFQQNLLSLFSVENQDQPEWNYWVTTDIYNITVATMKVIQSTNNHLMQDGTQASLCIRADFFYINQKGFIGDTNHSVSTTVVDPWSVNCSNGSKFE